jgi:hypothetical protein
MSIAGQYTKRRHGARRQLPRQGVIESLPRTCASTNAWDFAAVAKHLDTSTLRADLGVSALCVEKMRPA